MLNRHSQETLTVTKTLDDNMHTRQREKPSYMTKHPSIAQRRLQRLQAEMGPNISEPKVEKEKKVPKETGEAVEPEDLARPPVRVLTKEEEEIEEYYRLQEQMA